MHGGLGGEPLQSSRGSDALLPGPLGRWDGAQGPEDLGYHPQKPGQVSEPWKDVFPADL